MTTLWLNPNTGEVTERDHDLIMPVVTSYTTEQPTMHLRFNGGRLQQMMVVIRYENGAAIGSAEEWRDVPDATPQEPRDE